MAVADKLLLLFLSSSSSFSSFSSYYYCTFTVYTFTAPESHQNAIPIPLFNMAMNLNLANIPEP